MKANEQTPGSENTAGSERLGQPSPSALAIGENWTPGTWRAWDRGIGWEVLAGSETDHKPGRPINDEFRSTFTEADAYLIAAAKEMYDALETAQRIVEAANHSDTCEYDKGGDCSCGLSAAEYAMQRAFAKARGENA